MGSNLHSTLWYVAGFHHLFKLELTIIIAQQYQNPEGNYFSEVEVVLRETGNVLVSDPSNEVFVIVIVLSNSSDAASYRGLQANGILNPRT